MKTSITFKCDDIDKMDFKYIAELEKIPLDETFKMLINLYYKHKINTTLRKIQEEKAKKALEWD